MNVRRHAEQLLDEFYRCVGVKPKHNAIDLRLEKDACEQWAVQLNNLLAWGDETQIAEACYQLEPRLKKLKERIIIEVLTHGV